MKFKFWQYLTALAAFMLIATVVAAFAGIREGIPDSLSIIGMLILGGACVAWFIDERI